jgi:hypothetical protein
MGKSEKNAFLVIAVQTLNFAFEKSENRAKETGTINDACDVIVGTI